MVITFNDSGELENLIPTGGNVLIREVSVAWVSLYARPKQFRVHSCQQNEPFEENSPKELPKHDILLTT
jgi:hypothetical protein